MTKKKTKTVVRPNGHIWVNAEQFFNSAEVLFNHDVSGLVFPIVVNYALSVELALKSLQGKVQIRPPTKQGLVHASATKSAGWGHELHKLFSKLPPAFQQALEREFSVCTGVDLQPLLVECNDYFTVARYAHENPGSFSISNVRTLALGVLASTRNIGLMAQGLQPIR